MLGLLQATQEQSACNQQYERDRKLHNQKRPSQAVTTAGRRRRAALVQCSMQVLTLLTAAGNQPQQQSGQRSRHEAVGQYAAVGVEIEPDRQVLREPDECEEPP